MGVFCAGEAVSEDSPDVAIWYLPSSFKILTPPAFTSYSVKIFSKISSVSFLSPSTALAISLALSGLWEMNNNDSILFFNSFIF